MEAQVAFWAVVMNPPMSVLIVVHSAAAAAADAEPTDTMGAVPLK